MSTLSPHRPTARRTTSTATGAWSPRFTPLTVLVRRSLARSLPTVAGLGVVVAALLVVAWVGVLNVLLVAGAVALLAVAALVGTGVALLRVLRRRLGEMTHLPDLGRHVVTHHERAVVTEVEHDATGLTLLVAAQEVHQLVLDESGSPDRALVRGAETSRWRLPHAAHLTPEQVAALHDLAERRRTVRVVAESVVGLAGPSPVGWRLEADNGLVLRAGI